MTADIDQLIVSASTKLHDVLAVIDRGARGIALVCEDGYRLAGTITDGDIRRALLAEADLTQTAEAVMNRSFVSVRPLEGRAEVLDLMLARKLRHVPVVDADGRVVGLHMLNDVIQHASLPNFAVIMAGGRGTRLGALTRDVPKPMLPVAGRPIIERLVLHLVGEGITRIFVSVNYLGEVIEEHLGDGHNFGARIDYVHESEPMGTAGSISLLPVPIDHDLLVLNGDLITQFDVRAMVAQHHKGRAWATVATKQYHIPIPYGVVKSSQGRVKRFTEKPTITEQVNAGIYVLSPNAVKLVPREPIDMIDLLRRGLDGGQLIKAHRIEDDWIDVGVPAELKRARGYEH